MKTLVVGGSGFIGSYLLRELEADNLDLVKGQDVRDGIKKEYSVIIFLACNQKNTEEAYLENRTMFEALNEYRKKYDTYIIYLSSAAVYDLTGYYSMSKTLGEAYVKRFSAYAILRPSNVYGHGDGHGAPDRFMRGEKEIFGDGEQIRDLVPVEEVVTQILQCLEYRYTGIFNVSTGVGTSVNEIYKIFGKGKPKHIKRGVGVMGVKYSVLKPGKVG